MTAQKRSLIQRYTILKPKLEKARAEKKGDYKRARSIRGDDITIPIGDYEKDLYGQIRLLNEALSLLKDTYNGEDGEIA